MELFKEKGYYLKFKGFDWESGKYFEQCDYIMGECVGEFVMIEQWKELQVEVQ